MAHLQHILGQYLIRVGYPLEFLDELLRGSCVRWERTFLVRAAHHTPSWYGLGRFQNGNLIGLTDPLCGPAVPSLTGDVNSSQA